MGGTEKLHEAGFWASPEKDTDSTLSDTSIKSYQHKLKGIKELLVVGTLRYLN